MIYAFIDAQNVYKGVQSDGWLLDWRKFRVYLRDKYRVEKAFLFIGYMSQAIIITGDGDFTPLVKILQDKDKFMRVIAPNREYASSLLRKAVGSHITFMQEISQKVKRRKGLKR